MCKLASWCWINQLFAIAVAAAAVSPYSLINRARTAFGFVVDFSYWLIVYSSLHLHHSFWLFFFFFGLVCKFYTNIIITSYLFSDFYLDSARKKLHKFLHKLNIMEKNTRCLLWTHRRRFVVDCRLTSACALSGILNLFFFCSKSTTDELERRSRKQNVKSQSIWYFDVIEILSLSLSVFVCVCMSVKLNG